jgi:hypothetical protein
MKIFRDSLIVLSAILITLGFLELGMRAAGVKYEASIYESHPVLYTAYRPNAVGWTVNEGENQVSINSLGMHDRERLIKASARTIRLAFLGDSYIAGIKTPLEKTVTQVLERNLSQAMKDSGQSIEVLNFAVGGYALSQSYLSLDDRVWAFHPNIVAVCVSNFTVPNS